MKMFGLSAEIKKHGHPKFARKNGAPTSFGVFFLKFGSVLNVGSRGSAFRTIVGWALTQNARNAALEV